MHSITPYLRRLAARDAHGARATYLDADESFALWGAALDGSLPELELGALVASAFPADASAEELLGLHRALASRCAQLDVDLPGRVVAIPAYGLLAGEATLAVLLAATLSRLAVPVLLHGPLDAGATPSVPILLRDLGVMPSTSTPEAARRLREQGIAFLPASLLSPALAAVASLRARLGATGPALLAAQAIDPVSSGAVRLVSSGPRAAVGFAALARAVAGDALLLDWPRDEALESLAVRPGITWLRDGRDAVLFAPEDSGREGPSVPAVARERSAWIREVAARRRSPPGLLVALVASCLLASGAVPDLARAKALATLQTGRLAA